MENEKSRKSFGIPSLDKALESGKAKINGSSKGVLLKKENEFFLNLLLDTYNNETEMTLIKNSNDCLNQAPVLTWLLLRKKDIEKNRMSELLSSETRKESKALRLAIGAFWGMVMKEKYNMDKFGKQTFTYPERVFNFKTAARYKELS